jgi:hypothetical protein
MYVLGGIKETTTADAALKKARKALFSFLYSLSDKTS